MHLHSTFLLTVTLGITAYVFKMSLNNRIVVESIKSTPLKVNPKVRLPEKNSDNVLPVYSTYLQKLMTPVAQTVTRRTLSWRLVHTKMIKLAPHGSQSFTDFHNRVTPT